MALRFLKAASKAVKKAAKTKAAKSATQQAAQLKKAKLLEKARKAREAKAAKLLAEQKARKAAIKKAKSESMASQNAKKKPTTTKKPTLKSTGKRTTTNTKKTGVITPSRSVQRKVAKSRADRRSTLASKRRKAAERQRQLGGDGKTTTTSTKISQKTRRADSRKGLRTTESKGKSLTKAEKERLQKNKDRDIGAKAAAAKTPKSVKKTVSQAGGPAKGKGRDVPNSTDLTARQRDGKATLGKPQPKSTNAPQKRSGRVERNARTDARQAVDSFEAKARKTISDRVKRETEAKGLTGTQQRDLKRKLTRQMNAGSRRIKAAAEGRSSSAQRSAKTNTNPSVAYQEGVSGRDWRNRMSDSKVEKLSKDMTQRLSGKTVRGKGELVQSPKGTGRARQSATDAVTKTDKARRNASARSRSGTGTYSAKGPGKKADSSKLKEASVTKRTQPNKPRVSARKDSTYEPKGIDPNKQKGNAFEPSKTQSKRGSVSRATSQAASESRQQKLAAQKSRDKRSNAALRRRNEAANKASRRRAGEKKLDQMRRQNTSPGPTFQNKTTGNTVKTVMQGNQEQYRRFNGR